MKNKPFIIVFIMLFHMLLSSPAAAREVHQADIKINQTTFEDSITKLSEIFGTEIILLGIKDLPQHKFSLDMEQATFEQATKEAIRKAGLQSHALELDQKRNIMRIWIFQRNTSDLASRLDLDKNINQNKISNLEPSENFRMMTQEEYDRLEPDSQQNLRGMTSEEFQALEPEESQNLTMMTQEEYDRLEPNSQQNFRGITPEEFETLETDGPDDSKMITQEELDRLETE